MILNMIGGGGGVELNFDVKAYSTEAAMLAATPAENTIGVVTTTAISSWAFSATQPTSPTSGMVWVSVGTKSPVEFNALKENAIEVYPASAKQYVSSAWKDVTVMCYQNGAWVEFVDVIPMTADYWQPVSYYSDDTALTGTFSNGVYSVTTTGTKQSASIGTKQKITIDNDTKTIVAHIEISKAVGDYGSFYIFLSPNYLVNNAVTKVGWTSTYNGDFELDVENVSGDYFLVIGLCTWNAVEQIENVQCKYSNVRLLK